MDSKLNFLKYNCTAKTLKGHLLIDKNVPFSILINYDYLIHDLIKEAGTVCENFASDIYMILKKIEIELLNVQKTGDFNFFLGFQNSGVDILRNIHNRKDNFYVGKVEDYASIWQVDIIKEKLNNEIEVTINYGKVS